MTVDRASGKLLVHRNHLLNVRLCWTVANFSHCRRFFRQECFRLNSGFNILIF
jgi:hypothetical protein